MNEMTEDELLNVCKEEAGRGIGGESDNDSHIGLPLDYYFGRLPGMTPRALQDTNSSRYVSMDVMDSVEATAAEIMPTFTTDEIGIFMPFGEEDEEQCELETTFVNYLFFDQYNGWLLLQQAIKDVLLHKNCTVKAYWDERAIVEYETYTDVPAMAIGQILQPTADRQEVEIVHTMDDGGEAEDSEEMAAISPTTIKIKRTTLVGKPRIEAIAPENIIVCGDHNEPSLQDDCRFAAHESIETASSLIAQGFDPDIINELPAYAINSESYSRSQEYSESEYNSAHDSTKLIGVLECYILVDFDGDGIAERRKVVISGNQVLSNDEWDTMPLIGGVGTAVPHKYKGISMFDRMKDIQDTKTNLIRAVVDNTQLNATPRVGAVDGEVNLDDLLASRTGGVVRAATNVSVFEIPNPVVPSSGYDLLGFLDVQRTERGGSAVGTANQAQAVSGDTAHGIERVMSAMELSNAMIARTMGETLIRGIFVQLHRLIRQNHQGQMQAKIGGSWLTTIPSEWKARPDVSIQIGTSQSERARQSMALQQLMQTQSTLHEMGSNLISEEKAYDTIMDATKLAGIRNPEKYLVDPTSQEGQQKSQQTQQQQQEEQQKQQQMEQAMIQANQKMAEAEQMKANAAMASVKVKAENESLKNEISRIKELVNAADKDAQTEFDYAKLQSDNAIKLAEIEVQVDRDLNAEYENNRRLMNDTR